MSIKFISLHTFFAYRAKKGYLELILISYLENIEHFIHEKNKKKNVL